jgi:VanZ family protein
MTVQPITIYRVVAWALAAAIVILSLVPPELRPVTPAPHAVEHFTIYFATGLAYALGYRRSGVVAVLLVIFAGVVELAQLLVAGRHARWSDFIIDALAMSLGVLAVALSRRWRASRG